MRKLPLVIIFCLICSLILPPSTLGASKEYDHEALMEYDGYGKAMYETLVDETSFTTGQYTENKDFVSKSIDQIRDYANFWWNEQNWESEPWTYERFKEMVAKPTGYLLTVGDWVGKLFGGYGDKYYPPEVESGAYNEFIKPNEKCFTSSPVYCNEFRVNPGYEMTIGSKHFTYDNGFLSFSWGGTSNSGSTPFVDGTFRVGGNAIITNKIYGGAALTILSLAQSAIGAMKGEFANAVLFANLWGTSVSFKKIGTDTPITPNTKPNPYEKFRNHVYDNINNVATPEPRPYLVCPNGSKIQMSVSGSTFLSADGKAMIVNKDGTAEVDSAICKLGWDKPVVKYIDNRAAIQTPDGRWQDAETGKAIDEKEPDQEKEPNNPSCDISDEEMDIDSDLCEGIPYFGKKLEYIFGNATGNKHNIDRSIAMERQLNSIGIFDDATGRKLVLDNLSDAFDNPSSILKTQENGRIIRESLLSGPNGVLKVESVWDRERLITVKLYGGK
ncbi:hypothetical protein [Lysinibacillus sp. RC79]|uniref:hypothetical protein n=1 Tax=Lysinibacillus sp. RC79 TaxID=3156296 RepID=UPI0035164EDD